MNIITEYTLAHIRRNRRTSAAVMVAVLLAGTLICSFAMLLQGYWAWNIRADIRENGNWHGELFGQTPGEKLPAVLNNPHVEEVMVKGDFQAVRLPEGAALPYLFLRDADAAYWSGMAEQHTLTEGRLPQKPGEIAVSKLFFERNPQYAVGDTLSLSTGDRTWGGETLPAQSIRRDGEGFSARGEQIFTLTGKLDISTSTVNPGYYALGFLERENIRPDEALTVYLRFRNIHNTYRLLPEIAEAVGYARDEYGEYPLRYNDRLLNLHFVDIARSGGVENVALSVLAVSLMTALTVALVAGTFVLIIRGVFSLSADARVKQLGMFRSVGASPSQILRSVLLEGLILSALPLIASVGLGYAFTLLLSDIFNKTAGDLAKMPMDIPFHLPTAIFGVLLSLAVVLISAHKPARKIAKLTPIEAVRGGGAKSFKRRKPKKYPLYRRLFGFAGELAAESLAARRKNFRSATAAICISFVTITGMLCMLEIAEISNRLSNSEAYYDVYANLRFAESRDGELIDKIKNIPGAAESVTYSTVSAGMLTDESKASEALAAMGGLASIDSGRYNIAKKDGGYRIHCMITGLDEDAFSRYCARLGLDPAEYVNASAAKAIVQNVILSDPYARVRADRDKTAAFLNIEPGDRLTLTEQAYDGLNTGFTFPVTVGAVTDKPAPEVNSGYLYSHRLVFVVPFSQYDKIVAGFLPERAPVYNAVRLDLVTGEENSLEAERLIAEICGGYLGSEDYSLSSKGGFLANQTRINNAVKYMNIAVAVMIALIGVSNAFSSVAVSLRLRRREFAMLYSVGLDGGGLN
ncbi:MAG: ABC transporter permease, partial [Clostridiales bacterium]|nr:ABC transporter permease [Clostridiales bacterium]